MTAMSKYFWNEYRKTLLNHEVLNHVLKFHQRTNFQICDENVINKEQNLELIKLLECDKINLPSINLIKYGFEKITNNDLMCLVEEITDYYKQLQIIISLPIIYLNRNNGEIKSGCYTIDIEENNLIGYGNSNSYIESICNRYSVKIAVFLFINIEDAICLYNENGYIKSIEQVGGLFYKLLYGKINEHMKTMQCQLNNQKASHDLGINLRKELLIESLFLIS